MEDGKFYTAILDDDYYPIIKECTITDMDRVIIEYGFKVSESDIDDGSLYYYHNNNIYCCSWFDTSDKYGNPFVITKD